MFPYPLIWPAWLVAAVLWPAIQTLHALHKGPKATKGVWFFYWACFLICTWVFPYIEWIIYIPFYVLSVYVDIYYEAQILFVLALVLPEPLLIQKLFLYLQAHVHDFDSVAVILWNVLLIVVTIPIAVMSKCGLLYCGLLTKAKQKDARKSLAEFLVVACHFGWRAAIRACFWAQMDVDGLQNFRAEAGKTGRPLAILINHSSFFDSIVATTLTPFPAVKRVRMLMMAQVAKMPLIGVICTACGHIPLPFKSSAGDNFELDKGETDKKMAELDAHVKAGGAAGWFPEGRIKTGNMHEIGAFRAGGFKLTVDNDMEVWAIVNVGNSLFWPKKASAGGIPCRIGYKVFKVCDSSAEMCAHVAASGGKDVKRCQAEWMANHAQDMFQKAIDELVAAGYNANVPEK